MSSHAKWAEIWAEDWDPAAYLLTLRAKHDGSFEVIDPQKSGEVIGTFSTYEDAADWLGEDEFHLVGRIGDPGQDPARPDA